MRQCVVNTEDLKDILPRHRTKGESLTGFTRTQMVTTIHSLEEDLTHHKAYLDQLLTVIIDQNPQLLSMISEAQKIRWVVHTGHTQKKIVLAPAALTSQSLGCAPFSTPCRFCSISAPYRLCRELNF